jgi:probable HAF family extracellular repeat protein
MKSRNPILVVAVTLSAALAASACLAAQQQKPKPPRYIVTDLGTLGGPGTNSVGLGIGNAGWVAGSGNLTTGGPQHAFLWYGGHHLTDLGTLGGPACPACNSEAGGSPNLNGEAAIISDTSKPAYMNEDFCGFGTHLQCLGAIWKNGAMKALPNLPGGHNGQAYGLNDLGQVIGFSEKGIPDATCSPSTPSQVLRFEAVIWEPNGEIHELHPYGSDTVAFGFGVNDYGQAVGSSGLCSNTSLPPANPGGPHAVLWEKDGSATDLGNLGGTINVATSINKRGEVVGAAQSSKDGNIHSFLWTRESGMQDLGIFPGAVVTVAPCCNSVNDRGEVVGFSLDGKSGKMRAFLWRDRILMDLNTLIPADSPLYLQAAESINDAGEITGQGMTKSGEIHAFLATPCDH